MPAKVRCRRRVTCCSKALEAKLTPIVVINKIDRPDARIQEVLNEIYDLFIDLDAAEDQLDFPVLYTNAKTARRPRTSRSGRGSAAAVRSHRLSTFPAAGRCRGALQALVANLDYSDYLGRLAIARVFNGTLQTGDDVAIAKLDGRMQKTKITKLFTFDGLKRSNRRDRARRHRRLAGVEGITIGETITGDEDPAPLPAS